MKEKNESYINSETCNNCLFCAEVCPNLLIEKNELGLTSFKSEFYDLCITCGHCMAICPTNSIQIDGLEYGKDLIEGKTEIIEFDLFLNLLSNRRAIRQYKNKKLELEKIEKIIEAISKAPVSFCPNSLEICVINSREKLVSILPDFIKFYEDIVKMLDKPIVRFFIKKSVNKETFITLTKDIYPLFKYKLPFIKGQNIDAIFRGAPVAILIHADKKVANHTEDGIIAMTHGIIAAQALGLGSCPVSLIPPAINRGTEIKQKLNIPKENEVISSFIVGYSKHKYNKNIIRKMKKVEFVN